MIHARVFDDGFEPQVVARVLGERNEYRFSIGQVFLPLATELGVLEFNLQIAAVLFDRLLHRLLHYLLRRLDRTFRERHVVIGELLELERFVL